MQFFEAFGVDWGALFFQIVNFLLLLYLLNRFLFKRVFALLEERQTTIGKGLEDAETAARDRELARAERKIATDTRDEILAQARTDAEAATERAREEITAEKEKAMAELRAQVADLALEAAGKLVRSDMNATTQRRLVEEFLAETSGGPSTKAREN